MKHVSLIVLLLTLVNCVIPLLAQEKIEITYLAYIQRTEDWEIRGLDVATGNDILLMSVPDTLQSGARFNEAIPSPDGKRLLLRYYFGEDAIRIVELQRVELATQQITTIFQTDKGVSNPSWSPDSLHIVFSTSNDDYSYDNFWMYDVSRDLLSNPLPSSSIMAGYDWSPDEQYLTAHVVDREGQQENDQNCDLCPAHIDLLDLASGERTLLLDDNAWAVQPPREFRDVLCRFRWSPDRTKLVFVAGCVTAYVPGYADLYLLDIASKTVAPIVTSQEITGQSDRVEAYLSPVWVDNDTLWIGYFMRVSSETDSSHVEAQTMLYDLSKPGQFETIDSSPRRLVILQNETAIADSMDDFSTDIGTLEDGIWTVTDTLHNVCNEFISPDQQFVAYKDCDFPNSVTIVDLQTADVETVGLPENGHLFAWLVVTQ